MVFAQSRAAQQYLHTCHGLSLQAANHAWRRAHRSTGRTTAPGGATAPDHRSGLGPLHLFFASASRPGKLVLGAPRSPLLPDTASSNQLPFLESHCAWSPAASLLPSRSPTTSVSRPRWFQFCVSLAMAPHRCVCLECCSLLEGELPDRKSEGGLTQPGYNEAAEKGWGGPGGC